MYCICWISQNLIVTVITVYRFLCFLFPRPLGTVVPCGLSCSGISEDGEYCTGMHWSQWFLTSVKFSWWIYFLKLSPASKHSEASHLPLTSWCLSADNVLELTVHIVKIFQIASFDGGHYNFVSFLSDQSTPPIKPL